MRYIWKALFYFLIAIEIPFVLLMSLVCFIGYNIANAQDFTQRKWMEEENANEERSAIRS